MGKGLEHTKVLAADGYVTLSELAATLGYAPTTVRTWLCKGRFPPPDLKVGKSNLWLKDKVAEEFKSMLLNRGKQSAERANAARKGKIRGYVYE